MRRATPAVRDQPDLAFWDDYGFHGSNDGFRVMASRHLWWDGDVLVLGWEPRGGAAGGCEAEDADIKNWCSYEANTAKKLGPWTLPSPQESVEDGFGHGGRRGQHGWVRFRARAGPLVS